MLEIDNKFKNKLGDKGQIIDKKILNKSINNKEINIDVFVITLEDISKQIELNKEGISDIENNKN